VEITKDIKAKPIRRGYIFFHALAFVLGFSMVFVIGWGGAATLLGQVFVDNKVGATLGAILTLGFSSSTIGQAMYLSLAYSLGMGIPFLILALAVNQTIPLVKKLRKHMRLFQILSGILIIAIGILMVSAQMTAIARWALQSGLYLDIPTSGRVPGIFAAMLAGLLSFLSPCVLPLVPAYLGYLSGHALAATKQELNQQSNA
jgi:cytochrome c-type biogenesis protein